MFVELIYEDGSHSVACYETEEEAQSAINGAQERAKSGLPSVTPAPGERPQVAVRIKRALQYDSHPAEEHDLSSDEVSTALKATLKGKDVVSFGDLLTFTRDLYNPIKDKENPHDSQFKAEQVKELAVSE